MHAKLTDNAGLGLQPMSKDPQLVERISEGQKRPRQCGHSPSWVGNAWAAGWARTQSVDPYNWPANEITSIPV